MQPSGGRLLAAGWISGNTSLIIESLIRSVVYHPAFGVVFFLTEDRDSNLFNADVQWTSACRRLDGGNTFLIIESLIRSIVHCPDPTVWVL